LARTPDAPQLPIDPFVDAIVGHVRRSRAVVVTAQPGAGKTTRVPPALTVDGPVILLQPRRVAARAVAQRIAHERGWKPGEEIGWQIRFERRFSPTTRLLVVTEGILTARMQRDPLVSEFRTIVIDEFHERSIHADVAIALAKQAWRARDDLRIVVMSATLDSARVAEYLAGCPVVDVPGRVHPLDISYAPDLSVADAAEQAIVGADGNVLCFQPGVREIRTTIDDLARRPRVRGVDLLALHGSLDSAGQDAALQRTKGTRRIIVSTNVAETSVTVPGVTAVVDSGLHKVARYDAQRGIDSLEVERITQDSADQRAGRAGRERPGKAWRLWDARDRLRPHREPEIHRIDLSAAALDVIAWGGNPRDLDWFERPRDEAIASAIALLERLGAVRDGSLTDLGRQIRALPVHPRLAAMIAAAGGARSVVRACAILAERHFLPPRTASTSSDLLSALDDWTHVPGHVQRIAADVEDIAARSLQHGLPSRSSMGRTAGAKAGGKNIPDVEFRRAVLAGYPDRVAQRREHGSDRLRLASGTGARLAPESGVRDGEFLVALDVQAGRDDRDRDPRRVALHEAKIRIASRVEREWLTLTASEMVHRFDVESGTVKASAIDRYDALVLAERPVKPDPSVSAQLLADAWRQRGPDAADQRLLDRARFAAREIDVDEVIARAAYGARSLADIHLADCVPPAVLRAIDRDAPAAITLPRGRRATLEYSADGRVSASVKLQDLFGLVETPRIGPRGEAVLFALLAPNGRPVQLTRDLRSFWRRTYPEVRKELRARYPKHAWPEIDV
jgi:ATP-dependent helicase HrpB